MSVRCDLTVEDVMFLLRRNWFIDDSDIYRMFWELPEDVYYYVYHRRHELPREMHRLFPGGYPHKTKLKITNITEEEWDDMMIQKEEQRFLAVQRFKKNYIAPPRPREAIDDEVDNLQNLIQNKKVILEDMLRATKKYKKYVPVGQRSVEPEEPMIREQRDSIQKLENEFNNLKERTTILDKTWSESKYLDALLENVGSLYEN
jgi:hypothetical protein